ncbi:hypothetical protein BGZ50_001053 [Haplosporangium sp. Z 11]|nr:hypothetical protein BGZ50_001053 [Haplosporangium sp. Z 11]
MVYDLVYQAKRVIDTLYNHLYDNPEYEAFSSSDPSYVKAYSYDKGGFFGAEDGAKDYASEIQDKVTSVAESVSSAAAKATSTLISSSNSNNNNNHNYWISIGNHHGILERLQSVVNPSFWHRFDPSSTTWDNITPDLHALQSRLGLDHIAQKLNVEPRILFLIMLLPPVIVFLTVYAMAGAGNVSEDGPRPQGYSGPRRKTDPINVQRKENQSDSSSSRSEQVSKANPHTSSNTRESGKNRHGSRKDGTQDQDGLPGQQHTSIDHQYQLGSNNGPRSWATMLSSTGFMGAETMNYKPIDVSALLNKLRGPSDHTLEVESARSKRDAASATSSADHAVHGENVFSSVMEGIFGPSSDQDEQDGIDLDNHEEYDESPDSFAQGASKSPKEAKRVSSQSSPDWKHTDDLQETNTDQVHSHSEDSHSKNILDQGRSGKQGAGPAGPGSESLAGSSPLKRTRVPRAHKFKEADRHRHQPHVSYGQFSHSHKNQVSNGGESQWSIAAKIVDFVQGNAILGSLDGISGGILGATAITFAAFVNVAETAVAGLKMNIPSSMKELARQLRGDFDRVMNEGDLEGSGIDQDDNWSFRNAATEHKDAAASGQRKVSVDDIWVGPHTASAVYAEPIKQSNVDKDAKKKAAEPFADDGQAVSDDAADPPKAKDGTVVDRDTVTGAKVNRADIDKDTSLERATHSESSGATRSKKSKRKKNKAKLASQGLNVASSDQETAHRAEVNVENTAQDTKKAAEAAGDSIRETKAAVERDIRTTVQKAEDTALRVAGDAKAAVTNAEDALQMAARDTKKTIKAARGSAQKAVGTLAQGIEDSVKDAKGAAQGWAREAEDTMQRSAANAAHQAKAAVDSVVETAQDIRDTGLQRASLTARGAVSAVKDSIVHNVVEPTIHAEHIAENIRETCRGAVGANIQDAHDAAEKFGHDMKAKVSGVEAAAHKTKSSPSKKDVKDPHSTKDSANANAPRDLGKDESKTKSVSSSQTGSKVGDKSPEPKTESEPTRDVLSSAKHFTGGLGDATSEVLTHGASIAAQAATAVTDNTTALLGAAKTEILGTEMEHKHGHHGQHKELRDIKNEMKHGIHHQGIGSSQSSAAKKAKEVAKEYYDSLPDPQAPSFRSDSALTDTQRRKSKSAAIPMLDHDNYVFMDKDGGQVHMDDIDDDTNESDGNVENDDQSKQKDNDGILSHAPSILQSAKLAASAVAARVADVSYENFDIARHSLSDMIDNLSDNLVGHGEPDEGSDDADEEQDDVVVVPPTRNGHQSFSAAVQRPVSSTTSTGVQRQQQRHTEAHVGVMAHTHPSTISDHATSGTLSYSGAVKLNKDEGDHGPMYDTEADHTTKRPSQDFIHPHDDHTSGSLHDAELHEDKSHSHGRKGSTSAREPEPSQEQDYTVDEYGNKVDARRDSGFNLLV